MGGVLSILGGIAKAIGLASAIEAWMERRSARAQGVADNIAANNADTVRKAQDAQTIGASDAALDRQQLIDELRKE